MEDNTNSGYDGSQNRMEEEAKRFREEAQGAANNMKEGWNQVQHSEENKKLLAGLLAIFIGSLGIHKFILGYTKEGIIQILLNILCGLGALIALIEGIIYLTKTDEEFYQTYQVGHKGWF